jgi:hypothetical protein
MLLDQSGAFVQVFHRAELGHLVGAELALVCLQRGGRVRAARMAGLVHQK